MGLRQNISRRRGDFIVDLLDEANDAATGRRDFSEFKGELNPQVGYNPNISFKGRGVGSRGTGVGGNFNNRKKTPSSPSPSPSQRRNSRYHNTFLPSNKRSLDPARGEAKWRQGHWSDVESGIRRGLGIGNVRSARYGGMFEGAPAKFFPIWQGTIFDIRDAVEAGTDIGFSLFSGQRDYIISGDINRLYDVFDQSYDPAAALETVGGGALYTLGHSGSLHTEGRFVERDKTLFENALQSQKEMSSVFLSSFFN